MVRSLKARVFLDAVLEIMFEHFSSLRVNLIDFQWRGFVLMASAVVVALGRSKRCAHHEAKAIQCTVFYFGHVSLNAHVLWQFQLFASFLSLHEAHTEAKEAAQHTFNCTKHKALRSEHVDF
jgi:hypothetical protein